MDIIFKFLLIGCILILPGGACLIPYALHLEKTHYSSRIYNIFYYIQKPTINVQLEAIRKSNYHGGVIFICPNIKQLAEQVHNEMIIKEII